MREKYYNYSNKGVKCNKIQTDDDPIFNPYGGSDENGQALEKQPHSKAFRGPSEIYLNYQYELG